MPAEIGPPRGPAGHSRRQTGFHWGGEWANGPVMRRTITGFSNPTVK
jgi:hypothetical protein